MFNTIESIIANIRQTRPLILNITNHVTMTWIANGLLSVGASPIMTQSSHELDDLIAISQGVVINTGTLDDEWISRAHMACRIANQHGKPIIFDPVGAGASVYRTQACLNLLEQYTWHAIRGNASEIMALSGDAHTTKGVDSTTTTSNAAQSAVTLSTRYNTVVAMSGAEDLIIHQQNIQAFKRGSPMMPQITGSGCLLTAVVSAFCSVHACAYEATAAALLFYSVCGELAAQHAKGPGSFQMHFLDALAMQPERQFYE